MDTETRITLEVIDEDQATAAHSARAVEDMLRSVDGVLEMERKKSDPDSMDLGSIVDVVFTSGATLAVAQGIAAWLRARRNAKVVFEQTGPGGSVKTLVQGIDPATAERIIERQSGQRG